MSDMFFKLGTDADSTITLYPEWDFENGLKKLEKKHRLQNADLYVYKTGEYEQIEIKAKFMPLSDAAVINSWWQSNAELIFYQREKDYRDWSFTGSTEGWVGNDAILTASDNGIMTVDILGGTNGSIYRSNLSFQGSEFYEVKVNLKRISSGSAWRGNLIYQTAGVNSHDWTASHYMTISEPTGVDSDYAIATWDCRSLTEGGNDWITSEVTGIAFVFSNNGNEVWEVDYIDIGYKYSSVTSVMIRNTKKPFAKYQEPYVDYMQGTIKLEGY